MLCDSVCAFDKVILLLWLEDGVVFIGMASDAVPQVAKPDLFRVCNCLL